MFPLSHTVPTVWITYLHGSSSYASVGLLSRSAAMEYYRFLQQFHACFSIPVIRAGYIRSKPGCYSKTGWFRCIVISVTGSAVFADILPSACNLNHIDGRIDVSKLYHSLCQVHSPDVRGKKIVKVFVLPRSRWRHDIIDTHPRATVSTLSMKCQHARLMLRFLSKTAYG